MTDLKVAKLQQASTATVPTPEQIIINRAAPAQHAVLDKHQQANVPPVKLANSADAASEQKLRYSLALLNLQSELIKARNISELSYFIANEPRKILRAQQIIVFGRKSKAFTVRAISSLTNVDRSSPLVLWFEGTVRSLQKRFGLQKLREFDAAAFGSELQQIQRSYPLKHLVWVPWLNAGNEVIGGMLLARSTPWTEADIKAGAHLAENFAHAWAALDRPALHPILANFLTRRTAALALLATLLLLMVPVSMSALAPVEVVAKQPFVVTAGVDGVVSAVAVEPNQPVKSGQVLLTLADTIQRNRLEVAEREVQVAKMRYKKASQTAFVDIRGRHDLAITKAELDLKTSERDFARDLLERTQIKAEKDGIAFFGDKKDLVGRPVAVGERLMEIAAPDQLEFKVALPVADSIVLRDGSRVKVFLDSAPLHPIEARLTQAAYKATMQDSQQLAYRLTAAADARQTRSLRLGVRGTAQVYSDKVSLGFYLFRKPIAAARQWLGL